MSCLYISHNKNSIIVFAGISGGVVSSTGKYRFLPLVINIQYTYIHIQRYPVDMNECVIIITMIKTNKKKIGTSLMVLGIGLLGLLEVNYHYGLLVLYMMLLGGGIGINAAILTIAAQNAVNDRYMASATALLEFLQTLGSAIGVAIYGMYLDIEIYLPIERSIYMHVFISYLSYRSNE
jgi:hypothetical protein